jgi:hypothetical protein
VQLKLLAHTAICGFANAQAPILYAATRFKGRCQQKIVTPLAVQRARPASAKMRLVYFSRHFGLAPEKCPYGFQRPQSGSNAIADRQSAIASDWPAGLGRELQRTRRLPARFLWVFMQFD